jgi:hypothetical protein
MQARKTEKHSRKACAVLVQLKYRKQPHAKKQGVAMDAWIDPAKHFDTSGKSPALLNHHAICGNAHGPVQQRAVRRDPRLKNPDNALVRHSE